MLELPLKIGVLAAILVMGLLICAVTWLANRLAWWPSFLPQLLIVPRIAFPCLFLVLFVAAALPIMLFPAEVGVLVMVILWFLLAPGIAAIAVRQIAWCRDTLDDRRGAARIRVEILSKRGVADDRDADRTYRALLNAELDEAPVGRRRARPWPSYVIDAERLRRRRCYVPPGE